MLKSHKHCLKKVLTVLQIVPNKTKITPMFSGEKANFGIEIVECEEYVFKFWIRSVLNEKISNKYTLLPKISHHNITNKSVIFTLEKSRFSDCKNIKVQLQCRNKYTNLKSTNTTQSLEIGLETLEDYDVCRARAYIVKLKLKLRKWTEWFKLKEDKISPILKTATMSLGIIIVGVLMFLLAILFIIKKKLEQRRYIQYTKIHESAKSLPAHMIFDNIDTLSHVLDNAAFHQDKVMEEFEILEEHVKKEVEAKESFDIACNNLGRNRYRDILPYDSNLVTLSRHTGFPKSTYFNASWVNNFYAISLPATSSSGFEIVTH